MENLSPIIPLNIFNLPCLNWVRIPVRFEIRKWRSSSSSLTASHTKFSASSLGSVLLFGSLKSMNVITTIWRCNNYGRALNTSKPIKFPYQCIRCIITNKLNIYKYDFRVSINWFVVFHYGHWVSLVGNFHQPTWMITESNSMQWNVTHILRNLSIAVSWHSKHAYRPKF